MPSKFEFNKGKMVPYPSGAIVPDRDLGQRPALECIHLGIEFGGLKAVDDFSLTIGKTEIAGLIGPNGAGKTTVFNLLTKVYQPTHGTILLDGEDTSGKSVYQVNRMGIARTFQNIRLFNTMTVEDNVKVGLHNQERYSGFEGVLRLPTYWKHEKAAHERAMELLSIFDMEHLANEQAGSLPYGAQRRLEIVRALATNPKLLLLDEPAAGMNPSETAELMANIVKIRDTFGIAIMLIEHDMSLVMNICEASACSTLVRSSPRVRPRRSRTTTLLSRHIWASRIRGRTKWQSRCFPSTTSTSGTAPSTPLRTSPLTSTRVRSWPDWRQRCRQVHDAQDRLGPAAL